MTRRSQKRFVTVDVHMGTCGIAAGAQKIYNTLTRKWKNSKQKISK